MIIERSKGKKEAAVLFNIHLPCNEHIYKSDLNKEVFNKENKKNYAHKY